MIVEHEKMFADATSNIKEAQSRYKKDYDKKGVIFHCFR